MVDLHHRVKIFVFQLDGGRAPQPDRLRPHYLLLRRDQGAESSWGPLQGRVGYGEQLESAIRREVQVDTGLLRLEDLIDLQMPARFLLGDEEVIEWSYGIKVPRLEEPRLEGDLRDFRWVGFSDAYPSLQLEHDRAAIMRLHTLLRVA